MTRWWLLLLCCCLGQLSRAQVTLIDRGHSAYRIVVPAAALPAEQYAAEELQHYLERIGGVKLPIVSDTEPATACEILLGENAHAAACKLALPALVPDGFCLRTAERDLFIAGVKPRGTLYGVYALLEKLGVRWFAPDAEVVPNLKRVRLPALNETQTPAFEYREVYWSELLNHPDFAARMRQNGPNFHLAARHGGAAVIYYPFVHSLDALIPRALYKEHPDYFPLINGVRRDGYVQRCLSNPEVVALAKKQVRQWLKEHPEATIISVSQNDARSYCQCPRCKALDDAEGTPAASLLQFVNAIAEDIEQDYPNVRIDTLAYQYTRKAPKTLRPRPNVIIRLCSIECCFAHPLDGCQSVENRSFVEDIRAWQPIAPRLYVWDYTTNFSHYLQPFPNFAVLQANVRFFAQHGVKGLFEEGNYNSGGQGELEPLRAYLLAKLLWNPDADVPALTDEFLRGYYGKAAGKMQEYLTLLQQQVNKPEVHAHIFDNVHRSYLNSEFLQKADGVLAAAEARADTDAIRLRVQTAQLPIWYVQLTTNRLAAPEQATLLHRFLTIARQAGIPNISESKSMEAWAKEMGER